MLAHDSQLSLASFGHQTGVMLEQSQVNKDHDTDLVHKELKDIIYKLKENSLKHEINSLVQKSKSSGLSEQDTQLLQSLLKTKSVNCKKLKIILAKS